MEDLNVVKLWETRLRKEIDSLKIHKEKIVEDNEVPKQVKERFVDVLRTIKMTMIQVMAKCSQLRTEQMPLKSLKVRVEKLKFEYEEVLKSFEQLVETTTAKPIAARSTHAEEIHSTVSKELLELKNIIHKANKELDDHKHNDYQQRLEILESENRELKKTLEKIINENTGSFEALQNLKKRIAKLENNSFSNRNKSKSKNTVNRQRQSNLHKSPTRPQTK